MVRVCAPGWRTDTDIRSEVLWLEALAAAPEIPAPVPVRSRTGEAFVMATAPGFPAPIRCMVMSWLHGTPLGKRLTEANLAKMGALFAHMHAHGLAFEPPPGFTTRRMSTYLARDESDVLFESGLVDAGTAHEQAVLRQARAIVDQAFADRYADPDGLRVIHNDLWHDNIKVYRGRLQPLDFEDTIWGYPVQDIAMALQDLMEEVPAAQFESLAAAFRSGYEALALWPERYADEIDVFRAGRMLWVATYVTAHQREHLAAHLAWLAPQLERFLATGQVRKIEED